MLKWNDEGMFIVREIKTKNFLESLVLLNRIAPLAEEANHHPDVELGWGYIKIRLTTHDQGKVTEKDLRLSKAIDLALDEFTD